MSHLERCAWKQVSPDEFILGMEAERCGKPADVKLIRNQRKTDLFLCEYHLNDFIAEWGLHYPLELIDNEAEEPWCIDSGGPQADCLVCQRKMLP